MPKNPKTVKYTVCNKGDGEENQSNHPPCTKRQAPWPTSRGNRV